MQWSDLPLKPTRRMLRQFGWLWMLFFGAIAGWNWGFHHDAVRAAVFGTLASAGIIGLVKPSAARPIFVAWVVLAFPIGWVVSRLVLGLLFFGVFTPVGLIFRLVGRDVLQLRRRPRESYWLAKVGRDDAPSYFRQF